MRNETGMPPPSKPRGRRPSRPLAPCRHPTGSSYPMVSPRTVMVWVVWVVWATGPGREQWGARLLVAEALEVDLEDPCAGPLNHGLPHIDGQECDRLASEVEPQRFLPDSASGHDFLPARGQIAEVGQILGLTLGERHLEFAFELGDGGKREQSTRHEINPSDPCEGLLASEGMCHAKLWLTPTILVC
jgi:hypothetical protein